MQTAFNDWPKLPNLAKSCHAGHFSHLSISFTSSRTANVFPLLLLLPSLAQSVIFPNADYPHLFSSQSSDLYLVSLVFSLNRSRIQTSETAVICIDTRALTRLSQGQLWHSWQSGRFQHQRTRVRIRPSAKLIEHLTTVNCL